MKRAELEEDEIFEGTITLRQFNELMKLKVAKWNDKRIEQLSSIEAAKAIKETKAYRRIDRAVKRKPRVHKTILRKHNV